MSKYPVIISRSELLDFPELLLDTIPAKTDTGAYRSAVHAANIKEVKRDGKTILTFDLLKGHPVAPYNRRVETAEYSTASVENSFGAVEHRFAVILKIKLGTKIFKTEFTLADRSTKTYPILLGRKTLNGRFLVDSAKSHIDRKELKKKFNIDLAEDLEVVDP